LRTIFGWSVERNVEDGALVYDAVDELGVVRGWVGVSVWRIVFVVLYSLLFLQS
jgi:hypothetical protein